MNRLEKVFVAAGLLVAALLTIGWRRSRKQKNVGGWEYE